MPSGPRLAACEAGAADLLLDPSLSATLEARRSRLQARYEPRFELREPRSRGTFDHLQRGSLAGTLRLGANTNLLGDASLSLGSTDLSWLAPAPEAPPPSSPRGSRADPWTRST